MYKLTKLNIYRSIDIPFKYRLLKDKWSNISNKFHRKGLVW